MYLYSIWSIPLIKYKFHQRIIKLNVKPKTISSIEENRRNSCDLGLGKDFFDSKEKHGP